jgi:hypothetical protein
MELSLIMSARDQRVLPLLAGRNSAGGADLIMRDRRKAAREERLD